MTQSGSHSDRPALRIVVASPILPHPAATHGGAVCLGSLLEALAQRAEVSLVTFVRPSEVRWGSRPPAGVAAWRAIPYRQPFDLSGAALVAHKARMLFRWGLASKPLLVAKHYEPRFARALREELARLRPHAVLVEFAVMAQYLPFLANQATVLTDHECGEPLPAEIGPWGLGKARDRRLWARYVRSSYPRASAIQALNAEDAARLGAILGRPVSVRPLAVPLPATPAAPAAAPPRALFLGDYTHHPNPEAAIRLAREVWPLVTRRVPEAQLWLAGPRADATVRALDDRPNVRVVGYVENLTALMAEVRLMLAPLFSGGGSRIKVLTALAHGLPVVSNRLGLRGVDAPAETTRRGESAVELADAAVEFLRSAETAGHAGEAARRWAIEHLDPARVAQWQIERIEELTAHRRAGRDPLPGLSPS